MERLKQKRVRLQRRVKRVRESIRARFIRPRLIINCSNRYLWAQIVDDQKGATICMASTKKLSGTGSKKNKEAAARLGEIVAKEATDKGIKKIVLDRRGHLYHGRISSFATAARENGLEF